MSRHFLSSTISFFFSLSLTGGSIKTEVLSKIAVKVNIREVHSTPEEIYAMSNSLKFANGKSIAKICPLDQDINHS